jgi:hypothetical protein
MTQATDKEDEEWLNALAGRPALGTDPQVNQQAEVLRRALKARSEMLETQVPKADAAQYQQLLFRLRKEGLTHTQTDERKPVGWRLAAKRAATTLIAAEWQNSMLWGVAATLVLGVGIVIQMGVLHHDQDDANTLRGGGQSTLLIVTEPEVRLAELLAGLKAAGEEPTVKREADGRIVLTVKGTEKVLEYLSTQRIEPTLAQGKLTIELRTVKATK